MSAAAVDYRYASIDELAGALRAGQVSPAELARTAAELHERIGRRYNAVATVVTERAMDEAEAAARRLADGDESPLCGIPYGVKDLFAAVGGPTTWGSAWYAERSFDHDAEVVRRLSGSGGVLVAKLTLSEFAGGGRPASAGASMHGQGRNPWNPEHYSGGSSSGCGIAVAAGLVPFALGTETGGSVVGPAAFSGVTGLRPTTGLIPRDGAMTLSWTLDKVGPLARSAHDCAIVLDALLGRRPGDADSFRDAAAGFEAVAPTPLRVAYAVGELEETDPDLRPALAAAIEEFAGLPVRFVPVQLPRDPRFVSALEDIVRIEGAYQFRELLTDPAFRMSDERQQATLRSGLDVSAMDYFDAVQAGRASAEAAFAEVFSRADVVLSPSRTSTAPALNGVRPPRDPSKHSELLRTAGNLAGVPGISVPAGLAQDGLPTGLQLVGPRGSDRLLIALAAEFQRRTSHHLLRPPDPAG